MKDNWPKTEQIQVSLLWCPRKRRPFFSFPAHCTAVCYAAWPSARLCCEFCLAQYLCPVGRGNATSASMSSASTVPCCVARALSRPRGDKAQQEEVCPIIQGFCQKSHFKYLNPASGKSSPKGTPCDVFPSLRGETPDDAGASCSQCERKPGFSINWKGCHIISTFSLV